VSTTTRSVIQRLVDAWNRHDLEALLDCFDPDYESTQPLYPDRSFRGRTNVRERWTAQLAHASDFGADLLGIAVDGERAWTEWHWRGHYPDGSARDERGVIVYTVRAGRIVAGRLYMSAGPDDMSRGGAAPQPARASERAGV
jgi:ketosteroid isomerase-like protein